MSDPIDIERHAQFLKMVSESEVLKDLEKDYDRSFCVTVDNTNPRLYTIIIEAKDSGGKMMDIAEVALLLKRDLAFVRRLTEDRAQRRAKFPIPVVKINGRGLMFNRADINEWLDRICEDGKNGDRLVLREAKGRKRKK
jgi:hypothetical protein